MNPFSYLDQKGEAMNKDIAEGKWKQLKGKVRETWGKLTDDEIDKINGRAQQLSGVIQEKYGVSKEEAEEQTEAFRKQHGCD